MLKRILPLLFLLACATAWADTHRWRPSAAAVAQVDTITIADTWASGDDLVISMGNASINVTVGASDTATTAVATAVGAAINATDPGTVGTDSSVDVAGQDVPEFKEVTATVNGSVVTVTADTAGVPFTLDVVETTAGDGSATETTATAATGPNHYSDAANWDIGALPATNDDVVFDSGAVDCKYGLSTGIEPRTVRMTLGYTGRIGLPPVNQETTGGRSVATDQYAEYRTMSLTFTSDSGSGDNEVVIGQGSGLGSPMINVEWDTEGGVMYQVYNTGTPDPPSGTNNTGYTQYAVNIATALTAQVRIRQGSVALSPYGEGASVAVLDVGTLGAADSLTSVYVGEGATLSSAAARVFSGTTVIQESPSSSTLEVFGGTVRGIMQDDGSFSWTTCTIHGGSVIADALFTIGTLNVSAGTFTATYGDKGEATVTNANLNAGATINDPGRRVAWSNGIDLEMCGVEAVTLNIGENLTVTPSDL